MGQIRITQYIHRPNKTELGLGNTHECYLLVGSDIDMSDIFPPAQDVTIHDAKSMEKYVLKSSNYREFRINQMGDIYRDYKVQPGDEIIISQVQKGNVSDLSFAVRHYNRIVLFVKKGIAEINNIERLKPFVKGNQEYEIDIVDRGNKSKLLISFQGAMPKRADSPVMTDYYNVKIDGEKMPNGTFYLTIGEDRNVIANLPKSDYNSIEFDDKTIDSMNTKDIKKNKLSAPLQQIYYGAPGTGKSYEIDEITKGYDTIRTTFHPDSDYSTFVGAYKPTMEEVDVQIVPVAVAGGITLDTNKGTYKEKRITYKFVKQAFLKAYLSAWKKYAEAEGKEVAPQFLVIEEINRGNCAQIFGDLFQLLDRQDNGFSSYPIEADADLQREIKEAFANDEAYKLPEDGLNLDGVVKGYDDLAEKITNGEILLLPSNLYIWATMNTSDQSLFPIDSAFKRRWDWKYVKITDAKKGYKIKCGNEECDWWTFISKMNAKIAQETSSDDKKLGYFFCKPDDGDYISEERFVSKVMFYLWNDVFKDGETNDFNVNGDANVAATFEAFYDNDSKVDVANERKFLANIVGEENLKLIGDGTTNNNPADNNGNPANSIDYTKYSFDGSNRLTKKNLGVKIVQKYIAEHADEPFETLQNTLAFGNKVESQYQYHGVLARTEEITNSYVDCFTDEEYTSTDGVKYKILSWWNRFNVNFIIDFAKQQGWEVTETTK